MTPHPLDRISLTFGLCTIAAGGIVISHQAGWWKQPNLGVLVAFAIASLAVCVAVMWPRPKATAAGAGVDVSSTPGSAINRLPSGNESSGNESSGNESSAVEPRGSEPTAEPAEPGPGVTPVSE
ncbi:MAG: hypothetical protein V9G14_10500 [Cypionkella sp.]|jgi:hypothetical protein